MLHKQLSFFKFKEKVEALKENIDDELKSKAKEYAKIILGYDIEEKDDNIEQKSAEVKKESNSDIGNRIGNVLLVILIILLLSTGSLTYYLIHATKKSYNENKNEIIDTSTEEIEEPETIANIIDSALSDVTTNVSTNNSSESKKFKNEKLIVLYNGLILDTSKMDQVNLQYIDARSEDKDKYVITYESYENYTFKDSSLGILSNEIYEGCLSIENVGKVAISEEYNAIPRNIKVINTVPSIVLERDIKLTEYDAVKTLIIDLDGNGENEYILVLANKKSGFSKIELVDSKGVKVEDLASIEKTKWNNKEYYLSISNVEVLDIDNDGIMEILVEIPSYEGEPSISLLKYKNGFTKKSGEDFGHSGFVCFVRYARRLFL